MTKVVLPKNDFKIPRKTVAIPFYTNGTCNASSGLSTSERDRDATAHEIRYHPADPESQTYRVYVPPFGTGSPEQWLTHLSKIELISDGNHLTTGPQKYQLARALLKDDALREFNAKATELGNETVPHFNECLQAITKHVFPEKALQKQRRHLRDVRLNRNTTVADFWARWSQMIDYLKRFPPFEEGQEFSDEELVETVYDNLPKRMKVDIERSDFDIDEATPMELRAKMEKLESVYELELIDISDSELDRNQPESDNKRKEKDETTDPPSKKRCGLMYCLKCGNQYDHETNGCTKLKAMLEKEKLEKQSNSDWKKKKQYHRNKLPSRDDVESMVTEKMKSVMKSSFKEMFATHMNEYKAKPNGSDSEMESYELDV